MMFYGGLEILRLAMYIVWGGNAVLNFNFIILNILSFFA